MAKTPLGQKRVFYYASDLENINFNQETYEPWHSNGSYSYGKNNYYATGNSNGSSFQEVTKNTSSEDRVTYKKNLTNKNYHR